MRRLGLEALFGFSYCLNGGVIGPKRSGQNCSRWAAYLNVAAHADQWSRDEAEMRSWLACLDDETLARDFDLPGTVMATPKHRCRQTEFLDYADQLRTRGEATRESPRART